LLLVGGGHTHLLALPRLRRLLPQCRISLLAPSPRLLYSGMMPGWIAGQYRFEDCVIDLKAQCARWDADWIEAEAVDLRPGERRVVDAKGRNHDYDSVSINVGSATLANGRGEANAEAAAGLCIIGAKPFSVFTGTWQHWLAVVRQSPRPRRLVVVGDGAAGVELAFALARRVRDEPALAGSSVVLVMAAGAPLQGRSSIGAWLAARALTRAGVRLLARHRFVRHDGTMLHCQVGDHVERLPADLAILATGGRPPAWLSAAARREAIALGADGGIAVDSRMRSISSPRLWACGDCASFVDQKVPRSGVHAVRQAPALADSIALGAQARPYRAQARALALLNRCDGTAIAVRGPFAAAGRWAWRWKDRIDRRFVAGFAAGNPAAM
jgi:NADH dehydrogenase FAD-containing subunit